MYRAMGLDSIFESFVRDLQRKFGLCNLRYVEYALEGLDICVSLVFNEALDQSWRRGRLRDTNFLFYGGQLEELIICLLQIVIEWRSLKDTLDANELSPNAYRATAVRTGS